jgi:phosphoribosylaminoimidazole-succinocarboxamide synthase
MKDIYKPLTRIASRTMNRRTPIYEGKAKQLFEGPEPGTLIQHFKDDATAFNNAKKGVINGKGVINNRISEYLMLKLGEIGIPTHFIRTLNMREQLVKAVEIIPLEVIVRNVAAGSFSQRFGVEEGSALPYPIIEFSLKNDKLNDPIVAPEIIVAFQWAQPNELEDITALALRINDFLSGLLLGVGLRLIDFKIEFGRHYEGNTVQVILADEISPDCCRLWDTKTGEKMDKDRFRRDLGHVEEAYREVARRLGVMPGEASEGEGKTVKLPAKKKPVMKLRAISKKRKK